MSFCQDIVRLPNGRRAKRDYMLHPGAVTVAAFLDRDYLLMEKQYRYPVRKTIYELPAGKIDKGENPLACARRELAEETGYWPKRIKKILSFWPSPAFATEEMYLYVAWELVKKEDAKDEDEFLETFAMKFDQAVDWVRRGKIMDSKSVITILAIKNFGWNPYER